MTTAIDTDTLLGLFMPHDVHHKTVQQILDRLADQQCALVIPPTTLGEFALLASSRIGMNQTHAAVEILTSDHFQPFAITPNITYEAATLYRQQTSKEESLFDCFVMVTAKRLEADCIFSFDHGFTKNGFVLIEDFLEQVVGK
jgi:predicted nucleic acid-binding protein